MLALAVLKPMRKVYDGNSDFEVPVDRLEIKSWGGLSPLKMKSWDIC